jgi:hypothetical protein
MTDAPETIYAWADCEYEVGVWNGHGDKRYTPDQAKEYTRTDISQARIAELEATTKRDAKIYYDAKAIIDAHQVIYREAREEQRARIVHLEDALKTARDYVSDFSSGYIWILGPDGKVMRKFDSVMPKEDLERINSVLKESNK